VQPRLTQLDQAGDIAPTPLVTGDDLVAAGLSPGPRFRRMLEATYDEQLEGRLHTRDEALTFAMAVP
jgi:poly(A) polymerase